MTKEIVSYDLIYDKFFLFGIRSTPLYIFNLVKLTSLSEKLDFLSHSCYHILGIGPILSGTIKGSYKDNEITISITMGMANGDVTVGNATYKFVFDHYKLVSSVAESNNFSITPPSIYHIVYNNKKQILENLEMTLNIHVPTEIEKRLDALEDKLSLLSRLLEDK